MTRDFIRECVFARLAEAQVCSGRPAPMLGDKTRPIGDLEGFDSPLAEDVTALILTDIGAPANTKCPFTERQDGRCLMLRHVVDRFCTAVNVKEDN